MPCNILIVDDSSTTRAMIKRVIRMTDLPVGELFEAPDGRAALALMGGTKIDLVLADLNMPTMTGVEMTHTMRRNEATRGIPVIIVSAEPNIDTLEQLKRDGVQGYVHKPFKPEQLRDVILQVMGTTHA